MASREHLTKETVQPLDEQTRGSVILPDDPGYDEFRSVFNGMIDKYPSVILRATGTADVIAGVNFAREEDLRLAIKGGGHNFAGTGVCDDGLVIDLEEMNGVRVDPDERIATVQGGATWGDVDHETQAFGLATVGGIVSITGVAGLTLGGGQGYLARKHGMTIDNLVGADVVTADGELVHASEDENEDLFWAIRGGGGNFGVVTSFEFELHEVGPEVMGGPIFHPYEDAREALEFYRDFTRDAPDELATYVLFAPIPPEEPFPEERHGDPAVVFAVCYAGDMDHAKRELQPLRDFGEPLLDGVGPIPYTALQSAFDDGSPPGHRYYVKSVDLVEIPDGAIDTILEYTDPYPGELTQIGFEPLGGAAGRIDTTATAFPRRDTRYSLGIWPIWSDPADDDELIAWARDFYDDMTEYATDDVYVNYLDRDEDDRVETAYGQNYERLVDVKTKYDPENLFRVNQNIEPRT